MKDVAGEDHWVASEDAFAFGASQVTIEPATKAGPADESVTNAAPVTQQESPPARENEANETGPLAKVRNRLFSAAANRTPPSAPPADEAVQVPAAAATTSVQSVSVTAPAPATEAIPPKMLDLTDRVLLESPRPPDVLRPMSHTRQWKKAAELAAIIEHDLAQHPDSPKQGLRVTVYGGGTDWRAMLMFLPAAGPVRNAQQLREVTEHLAEGLRQRHSLAWD